jgi:hypothetical protein
MRVERQDEMEPMEPGDILSLVCVAVPSFAVLGGGIWIVLYQVLGWFRIGHWTPMTLADGLSLVDLVPPAVEWVGVQKILDWIEGWPLSVVFLVPGAIMTFGFWEERRQAKRRQLQRFIKSRKRSNVP